MSLRKKVVRDKNFEMDPSKVPIADFPIDRMQPIRDFNNVCYNAAVEFVDGYGQDSVRNSKAGMYCKNTTKRLIKAIGKNPCQYGLTSVPVIELRPKFYAEALGKCDGDADKALEECIRKSRKNRTDEQWCHAAHTIYKNVYDDKMPELPQPYSEYYREPFVDAVQVGLGDNPAHKGSFSWLVPVLIALFALIAGGFMWVYLKNHKE